MANFILNFVKRALGTGRIQVIDKIGNFDSNLIVPEITLLEPAKLDGLGSEISALDRPSKEDQSLTLSKGSNELLSVDRILNENNKNIDENVGALPIDLNDEAVRKLLAKGKRRGFITYDELNAVLPQDQMSSDQIADIMSAINYMGVEIVENDEAGYGSKDDDGLLKNNNANAVALGSSLTEAINSPVPCLPDGLVLEQPQAHIDFEEPSEFSILEQTLESLIKTHNVSVRLRNCSSDVYFCTTTLKFALDHPKEFEKACYKVPNLGRKTLNELQALVNSVGHSAISCPPETLQTALTLNELVSLYDASLRLKNAVAFSELAEFRVTDAVADMVAFVRRCRKITRIDKESVSELTLLLIEHSPVLSAKAVLGSRFNDIKLEQIFELVVSSARLKNGVLNSTFRETKLGYLVQVWPSFRAVLAAQKNFGRRSLDELSVICSELVVRFLASADIEEELAQAAADLVFYSKDISDEIAEILIEAVQGHANFKVSDIAETEIMSPDRLTETLLLQLKHRPREVLQRRYGIGLVQAETLEQIGADHGVTRERIRQIEKKASAAISIPASLLPIRESLVEYGEMTWNILGGDKGFVTQDDIKNVRKLPAEFALLSDVGGITLTEWLDAYGTKYETGWCSKSIEVSELDAAANAVAEHLDDKAWPRPCLKVESRSGIDLGPVVAELKLGKKLCGGYVVESKRGTLLDRRVIKLHSMLGSRAHPIPAQELVQKLAKNNDNSTISIRYISAIMTRFPHLFLEGDDAEWFGLGTQVCKQQADLIEHVPLSHFESEEGDSSFTMASFLKGILERTGPMKLSKLVAEARQTIPADRSIASVGPSLIIHRELFVRVLPGVYGLQKELPSVDELLLNPPTYLTNDEQARLFALGRRAGEPWSSFTLWTPAAEYVLCRWAKKHANSALYESLLTVATTDDWPVSDAEKMEWRSLIENRNAKFHLHFEPRTEVGYALPKLDRFLAACLQVRAFGTFNWIVGNRILNRPADAHISAGLVSLMNALGVLNFEASSNWQMPQFKGKRIDEIIFLIEDEIHNFGTLDWDSPLGNRLLSMAREHGSALEGWIDNRLLLAMVDRRSDTPAISDTEELSDLDKLLLEFGQANEAKMFDQMLDDLASDELSMVS